VSGPHIQCQFIEVMLCCPAAATFQVSLDLHPDLYCGQLGGISCSSICSSGCPVCA
jgi:hypothetical protein